MPGADNDTVAEAAVTLALSLGYTHVDTAIGYANQAGIAKALKASTRPRSSYFVTVSPQAICRCFVIFG